MINNTITCLLKESDDTGFRGYATVEVKDLEGDIIRVSGLDFDHSDDKPLKIWGAHPARHGTIDKEKGTPKIIGLMKGYERTTAVVRGQNVPAIVFEADWAREGDQIYDYAAKFKGLFEARTLDSFSIGMKNITHRALKGGRHDVVKATCYEISAAPIPANPYCTIIKELQTALGDDFDPNAYLEARLVDFMQKSLDGARSFQTTVLTKFDDLLSALADRPHGDRQAAQPKHDPQQLAALQRQLSELSKALNT